MVSTAKNTDKVLTNGIEKLTKNQRKRLKKKLAKEKANHPDNQQPKKSDKVIVQDNDQPEVEIEYVSSEVSTIIDESNPAFEEFQRIFERFTPAEELCREAVDEEVRWLSDPCFSAAFI